MPALPFVICTALSIERIRRQTSLFWAVILGVSLLAMMLTHYFCIGAAIGLVGYALVGFRNRAQLLVIAATALSTLIYLLLWGPAILAQRKVMGSDLDWLVDESPGHLYRRLVDLCRLPIRYFAEITDPKSQLFIAFAGAAMLLSLPILFIRRPELRMWIAWMVASIALVALSDFTRGTTELNWVRYTLFAMPPAYVLLAAAVGSGRWKFLVPAIAAVLAIVNLRPAFIPPWKTDFRTPVQFIDQRLQRDDGLVIIGTDPSADGIMFAAFQHYLSAVPATSAVLTAPPNAPTLLRLQQCPHVWIVRLWPDHQTVFPGFVVEDQQTIPYFADLVFGGFRSPNDKSH
jgi:hypothetical protein